MNRFNSVSRPMASLVLAIAVSAPAGAQVDADQEQMMNLVLQVQQMQDELRMMRGMMEEQAYELESIKRRQRDQYLDLDQRISELSSGAPVRSGAFGVDGDSPGVSTQGALDQPTELASESMPPAGSPVVQDRPEVSEPVDAESAIVGLAEPAVVSREQAASPAEVQAAYDHAFQALKELRYADAAREFQDFIDVYPDSEYTDNALYWLGESYYVTRNYEIALEVFENLTSRYPDSAKAGDGLLKVGFTHYELKQWDQARAALEQVQTQYPNTTLARLAESRLRSMRLEGHF